MKQPTMQQPSILRNEEGSIFIEMIFFLPIIILIWTLLGFIYQAKHAAVDVQNTGRECAWQYALNGCTSALPAKCQGGSPGIVDDSMARSETGDAFGTLRTGFSAASQNYANAHGKGMSLSAERDVTRPGIMGGTTTAIGKLGTMCGEDPPRKWTQDQTFLALCKQHGVSSWCRL